ncbi:MAG: hypothetical protein M3008_03500 [Chloroflexota bacterium]|nr:hypothetical protein [Chloroflexota bacterium]
MATRYQPLIEYVAAQHADTVTLSFADIAAIVGSPLPETMQVDYQLWKSAEHALVWRLEARGWRARLDRRNRCVRFTRDVEE